MFDPISNFLKKTKSYAVLIMDEPAMFILQCFFNVVELTDMRMILKENIATDRVA